eukprot:6418035-Amphidinium_carterae.2
MEEGMLRCLSFEKLTAKEVCKLSELEKLEHQKHVTSLYLQLQKARGAEEMEVVHDVVEAGGRPASHEDMLQALKVPTEMLLSILEKEVGVRGVESRSALEGGNSWMEVLTHRLDTCCSMLPRIR